MNSSMRRRLAIVCLIAACSVLGFGLTAAAPGDTPQPDISGIWSGSFDITLPDGSVKNETAWLNLKQDGNALTGTAGPSADKQSEIKEGKVNGPEIQFSLEGHAGDPLRFRLHEDGGHLTGDVTRNEELPEGGVKIKLDVMRADLSNHRATAVSQELYDEISHMDTVLFNAFNQRDLAKLRTLFTGDLEFYHDRGGLTFYEKNMEMFKTDFARDSRVRRQLVDGSLEIYPIQGYGAVEIGVHQFYSTDKGEKEKLTATAKFVQVWRKTNDGWKISRVISYDHQ